MEHLGNYQLFTVYIMIRLRCLNKSLLFKKFLLLLLLLFYFTILHWFCHTSTCIRHGCTCVPHPEPPSHLHPIPSLWVILVQQPQASCILHRTWTGDSFFILYIYSEKAMAPHSSTLAWKIPWMEEPGGLQSTGSLRVGHD